MNCLVEVCLYLVAALGIQETNSGNEYGNLTGQYGVLAEASIFYSELKHLSGLNTYESDGGFNAVFAGIRLHNGALFTKIGIGWQFSAGVTNEYDDVAFEWTTGLTLNNGITFKSTKMDESRTLSAGIINNIFGKY